MLEDNLRTLILESLQEVNQEKPIDKQFEVSHRTKLLAKGSAMDSLDYLNFSTHLEERLFQAIGREVDEAAQHRAGVTAVPLGFGRLVPGGDRGTR